MSSLLRVLRRTASGSPRRYRGSSGSGSSCKHKSKQEWHSARLSLIHIEYSTTVVLACIPRRDAGSFVTRNFEHLIILTSLGQQKTENISWTWRQLLLPPAKCVLVEDWFKCLRERIFFGKSVSKRIGFPANHILSEISTVKNCIQICLPQDRFSGSCRDGNLNVVWEKHIIPKNMISWGPVYIIYAKTDLTVKNREYAFVKTFESVFDEDTFFNSCLLATTQLTCVVLTCHR